MPAQLDVVPSIPFQRARTSKYVVDLRWNERAAAWFMDLYDEAESPIRVGIKVVIGTWLGRRSVDPRFPPGAIVAIDTSGAGRDATLDDLGTRVILLFYSGEEILAAVSGA
jgi:hypothetical protein